MSTCGWNGIIYFEDLKLSMENPVCEMLDKPNAADYIIHANGGFQGNQTNCSIRQIPPDDVKLSFRESSPIPTISRAAL